MHRAITHGNLVRLRTLGGLVGLTPAPPFHQTADDFKSAIEQVAAIPFEGRVGYEGIAIGSDFLESSATIPELGNAPSILDWISRHFDDEVAGLLLDGNARRFLASIELPP